MDDSSWARPRFWRIPRNIQKYLYKSGQVEAKGEREGNNLSIFYVLYIRAQTEAGFSAALGSAVYNTHVE